MTRPALSLGARLGHYTIVERLGSGGMGEVYRARDDTLGRDVALKVLPSEVLGDATARERLLREARTASSLNHPHICTIYEVGEQGDQVFIAMEVVEGRPLVELIGGTGLSPATVLRYGIQVADALAHAHGRGVIHRDLKSANVMVTPDGCTKVLDFGLARRVATEGAATITAPGLSLTETGAVVGTPHYLSPEALHGGKADARSDIWALGVLLHEMVAGELPFAGQTAFEVGVAIMHSPPNPLPESVPPGLRTVVGRCLEKEPGQRYQCAGEVRAALEAQQSDPNATVAVPAAPARGTVGRARPARRRTGLAAGIAAILLVVSVVVLNRGVLIERIRTFGGPEPIRSLAVLPLENLSRDPEQAYFADGITQELSTHLARISALRLIAYGSVMGLARSQKSLSDIGRALRVAAVLRGSVRQDAGRVRITVQLVQVATGKLLWADSYERALRDVLTL